MPAYLITYNTLFMKWITQNTTSIIFTPVY